MGLPGGPHEDGAHHGGEHGPGVLLVDELPGDAPGAGRSNLYNPMAFGYRSIGLGTVIYIWYMVCGS